MKYCDKKTEEIIPIKIIAHIHTDFPEKFGIPRQSGLVDGLNGKIVFEKEYRSIEALRGLNAYSHIWLIWHFSKAERNGWSATVRPPRLGGDRRIGVFATRSPFRPNALGLSAVKLEKIEEDENLGPVLYVSGVDMLDDTPIFDIKPYLPFSDAYPNAVGGFADDVKLYSLKVDFPYELLRKVDEEKKEALIGILSEDPRPAYHSDENRLYGFVFADMEVKFTVCKDTLTVRGIEKIP